MAQTEVRPTTAEREDGPPALHPDAAAGGGEPRPTGGAAASRGQAALAALLAWLVPGAGHLYLGRRARALVFAALVGAAFVVGVALDGKLWQIAGQEPATFLHLLGTIGCMGLGVPYFVLRAVGYGGDLLSSGYEYGGAFLLTAGLMNLLLVLDAWDVARGVKP